MPKKAFDYNKTEIYKIIHCDPEKDFCYIGHTTNFTERKKCHKKTCTDDSCNRYNQKGYQIIRENGGWENFKMVFIEKWPCENLREAQAREQHWMDTLKPNMNDHRAFITKEQRKEYLVEYYNNKRQERQERQRDYYQENKEKLNIKFECECGGKYLHQNKSSHFKSKKHMKWAGFQCVIIPSLNLNPELSLL